MCKFIVLIFSLCASLALEAGLVVGSRAVRQNKSDSLRVRLQGGIGQSHTPDNAGIGIFSGPFTDDRDTSSTAMSSSTTSGSIAFIREWKGFRLSFNNISSRANPGGVAFNGDIKNYGGGTSQTSFRSRAVGFDLFFNFAFPNDVIAPRAYLLLGIGIERMGADVIINYNLSDPQNTVKSDTLYAKTPFVNSPHIFAALDLMYSAWLGMSAEAGYRIARFPYMTATRDFNYSRSGDPIYGIVNGRTVGKSMSNYALGFTGHKPVLDLTGTYWLLSFVIRIW